MKHIFSKFSFTEPCVIAALLSLVLAVIMSFNFFINPDGIYYLKAAEDIQLHGFNAVHPALNWPFYPVIIALFSSITHIPLLYSALFLQAFLQVLLIISFINIVKLLGGNRTIQLLAAATLLLHPELNEYRGFIIRDWGYWACFLTSLYYFLRYWQQPSWQLVCAWTIGMAVAILFRIEGIVIIVLAPLLGFVVPNISWRARLLQIIYLYLPWLLLGLSALIFLFTLKTNFLDLGRLAELSGWFNHLTGNISAQWNGVQAPLSTMMEHMDKDSIEIFMLGGLAAYVLYELIGSVNIVFFVLIMYGQWHHYLDKYCGTLERRLLYGFLAINLLIPSVFVSARWFLTGRFLMPAALILLLWVPFILYTLYQERQKSCYFSRYQRPAQILLGALIIYLLIDSTISFNSPAALIKQGATWVQNNTPVSATVYTNSPALAFYAERPGMDLSINTIPINTSLPETLTSNQWKQYDYLAIFIKRHDQAAEELVAQHIPYPPIQQFENSRGYKVLIFKVEH